MTLGAWSFSKEMGRRQGQDYSKLINRWVDKYLETKRQDVKKTWTTSKDGNAARWGKSPWNSASNKGNKHKTQTVRTRPYGQILDIGRVLFLFHVMERDARDWGVGGEFISPPRPFSKERSILAGEQFQAPSLNPFISTRQTCQFLFRSVFSAQIEKENCVGIGKLFFKSPESLKYVFSTNFPVW